MEYVDRGYQVFNAELVRIHLSADRLNEELRWRQSNLFDRRAVGCGPRIDIQEYGLQLFICESPQFSSSIALQRM